MAAVTAASSARITSMMLNTSHPEAVAPPTLIQLRNSAMNSRTPPAAAIR